MRAETPATIHRPPPNGPRPTELQIKPNPTPRPLGCTHSKKRTHCGIQSATRNRIANQTQSDPRPARLPHSKKRIHCGIQSAAPNGIANQTQFHPAPARRPCSKKTNPLRPNYKSNPISIAILGRPARPNEPKRRYAVLSRRFSTNPAPRPLRVPVWLPRLLTSSTPHFLAFSPYLPGNCAIRSRSSVIRTLSEASPPYRASLYSRVKRTTSLFTPTGSPHANSAGVNQAGF